MLRLALHADIRGENLLLGLVWALFKIAFLLGDPGDGLAGPGLLWGLTIEHVGTDAHEPGENLLVLVDLIVGVQGLDHAIHVIAIACFDHRLDEVSIVLIRRFLLLRHHHLALLKLILLTMNDHTIWFTDQR